jgi:putative oxidoreductase
MNLSGTSGNDGRGRDIGLFVLRMGLGIMFLYHGWPKIVGGPTVWTALGGAIGTFGIAFWPGFWGFMAAVAEFVGALALICGLFFRTFCTLMLITMIVAAAMHLHKGDGLGLASHAIELGIVFLSLIFIGPGRLSLQALIWKPSE